MGTDVLLVEAAVTAIMSAIASDVWPTVRDRISHGLSPADPTGESARLNGIATTVTDEHQQAAAFEAYVEGRLAEDPELADALKAALREVQPIIVAGAGGVNVDATGGTFYFGGTTEESWPPYLTLLAMDATWAAQAMEEMPHDDAIARLWAMRTAGQTDAAVRRLALMQPAAAADLLSMMDTNLAAELLSAMTPPHPAALFVRVRPARGAEILAAMRENPQAAEQAVMRMAEIAQTDPDRAALVLFEIDRMDRSVAALLLDAMDAPQTVEVFNRMAADVASAVLAAMETEPAARHVAEMDLDRAALLVSKMDRNSARDLMFAAPEPLSVGLLARMAVPDSAEVLASMPTAWACEQLAKIRPMARAVDLLVALRPPRTLLHEVSGTLAADLLREAVLTLARLDENRALYESAQEAAVRIRAEAEKDARKIRRDAEDVLAQANAAAGVLPNTVPLTLRKRIIQHLERHRRLGQTLSDIATATDESGDTVQRELDQMIADGIVKIIRVPGDRSGIARYALRRRRPK